jgi:hypothetical protein
MTDEQPTEEAPPLCQIGSVKWGIPDVDYSNVEVYLFDDENNADRIDRAMRASIHTKAQWDALLKPLRQAKDTSGQGRQGGGAPRQGGQGGRQDNPWPPVVVMTVDDDGYDVPGCSWHNIKRGDREFPRPMKPWDRDTGLLKCTGKTQKPGNEDGFCPLRHQPADTQVVEEEYPPDNEVPVDDVPF